MHDAAKWITEAEVVDLMDLGQAIDALEAGLKLEAQGAARNMTKTHLTWGPGDTLHAVGAVFDGAGYVGTKTWAHTGGGAMPLLIVWNVATGALVAVIEAFALGQMRTGAMSGVATRWMAAPDANTLAIIGTGRQAASQLAAVAAVRRLSSVKVYGRDKGRQSKFIQAMGAQGFHFPIMPAATVGEATDGAAIVSLATRAQEPFFTSALVAPGTHINAIGAITPEREEFAGDILSRADLVAVDDPDAVRRLSKEFSSYYGEDDEAWRAVKPISHVVSAQRHRPATCDLSVFKAMGMGISDMALGIEILRRAEEKGCGRPFALPRRAAPRLSGNFVRET